MAVANSGGLEVEELEMMRQKSWEQNEVIISKLSKPTGLAFLLEG